MSNVNWLRKQSAKMFGGFTIVDEHGRILPSQSRDYYYDCYNGARAISPIATAITKITNMCSIVGLDLYKNGNLIESGNQLKSIQNTLRMPNKDLQTTFYELNQALIVNYLCSGQIFIRLNMIKPDRPIITVLSSERLKITFKSNGQQIDYIQYTNEGNGLTERYFAFTDPKTAIEYFAVTQDSEIKHILFTSNILATNEIIPPLRTIEQQIDLLNEINEANIQYARNAQNASANVFIDTDKMTERQVQQAEEKLKQDFSGSRNAGKINIFYGLQANMVPPPENRGLAAWYEIVKSKTVEEIYSYLGVPIILITPEKTSYNNMSQAKLDFLDTIKTYVNRHCNILTQYILPFIFQSLEFEIRPNYSNIQEIQEYKTKQVIELVAAELLTIEEARQMLNIGADAQTE